MRSIVIGLLISGLWVGGAEAKDLAAWSSAKVKVIDGDSIVVGGKEVRMEGIDAPEYHQNCFDAKGETYACGVEAYEYLRKQVKGKKVRCEPMEIDRYKRVVAVCFANDINLNAQMVKSGHAVAYDRYDDTYVPLEKEAMRNKRGIWQGKFMRPEFWRLLNKRRK